ncbi:uncharacterized protein LOC103496144 isoform X1 [Cucumis melo]|uniref:Uncharacterized protein LOC103496144 isoform X1 n=1 Tax=Cucumis melo TaxID=3656 RepID=A0A1S4E0W4_CUCME|nr:uncharacterized protein LOC103496144 isoform X1 [Cucumis melo]
MEKSAAAAAAILCLLLLSAEAVVTVSADAADCIDACFTACVQKDNGWVGCCGAARVMQRCEGKCRIKCGPDNKVDENIALVRQNNKCG